MNLTDKTATVFFANSRNGHILAEQIIPESIPMQHANNYFFPKWGFASRAEDLQPDWRENPSWGMARPEAFTSGRVRQADPLPPIPAQTVSLTTTQHYRERSSEIRQSSSSQQPQTRVEDETKSRPLFTPTQITPKSPTDI